MLRGVDGYLDADVTEDIVGCYTAWIVGTTFRDIIRNVTQRRL